MSEIMGTKCSRNLDVMSHSYSLSLPLGYLVSKHYNVKLVKIGKISCQSQKRPKINLLNVLFNFILG